MFEGIFLYSFEFLIALHYTQMHIATVVLILRHQTQNEHVSTNESLLWTTWKDAIQFLTIDHQRKD